MAARAPRRRLSFPLLLVCALLGYIVSIQRDAPLPVPPEPTIEAGASGRMEALPGAEPFEMPPLGTFTETLNRPLFMATRQPPEPEAVAVVVPEPEPEPPPPELVGLELTGIIISADERLALIQRQQDQSLLRLSEGEQVDGWTVDHIEPDRILLRQGETLEELVLKDKARPVPTKRQRQRDRRLRTRQQVAPAGTAPAQPRSAPPAQLDATRPRSAQ